MLRTLTQILPWNALLSPCGSSRRRRFRYAMSWSAVSFSAVEPELEDRRMLAAASMTDQEQMLLELINRARANPEAEAARYGIALNQGLSPGTISSAAKQPLAPHQILINIAGAHALDMLNRDYFSHTTLGTNNGAAERATAAGYPTTAVGENIGWGGSTGSINQNQQVFDRHQALFLSPGHRQNLLHPPYNEAGMGVRYGVFTQNATNYNAAMVTENFGIRNVNPFITGVVYTDLDANNFYSIGEAVRSGTVTAVHSTTGTVYTAAIGVSGSYSLNVPAGTYHVTAAFSLSGMNYYGVTNVQAGTGNVKADFKSGDASPVSLSLSPPAAIVNETGPGSTVMMTLTRNGTTADTLTVQLTTTDTTETSVPPSVIIPAGQSSIQFSVSAVHDNIVDGDQQSTISATATGFGSTTARITTVDRTIPVLPASVMIFQTPRPQISWTEVSNAASYEIWISNDSTGEFRFINHGGISTSSYTPQSDLPIGEYRVWVRAVTATGLLSGWSVVQSMRIMTRPTIADPGAVHSLSTIPLQWSPVPGAARYDVWIDHQSTSTGQFYRNMNVTDSSLVLNDFPIGRYAVWVRAANAAGYFAAWSPVAIMTVNVSPQILTATAEDFATAPTVTWSSVLGATHSEIWINNVASGGVFYYGNTSVVGSSLELPSVPPAGNYRVWVRARDGQGTNFAWSSPFDFEVNRPPRILNPLGGGQTVTPGFSWTGVSGAVRYELWVSRLSTTTTRVIHVENLTELHYTPTAALNVGTYRTWIRAFDSTGAATSWSPGYDFTVVQQQPTQDPLDLNAPLLTGLERLSDAMVTETTEVSAEATGKNPCSGDECIDQVFSAEHLLHSLPSDTQAGLIKWSA